MAREEENTKTEVRSGDFGECLVGGSPEEQARRRKIKRRALVISVALQSLGLAVLVIAPLLAKPAELKTVSAIPIPPYYAHPASHPSADPMPPRHTTQVCVVCANLPIVPIAPDFHEQTADTTPVDLLPGESVGSNTANWLLSDISGRRPQPVQPTEPKKTTRIHKTSVDPALLIYRVEPVFPPLARQIRRSGKVELHAIIATDGTIQSLQVVSGDPMFIESAKEAVLRWRYKPTYLNGQPVEIDTFVTVVYTLSQP
jgi:periplasmic protein TonB